MKASYIALIRIVAHVDGERVEIQPGEALPDGIHEHDIAELKGMHAIEDLIETAQAKKNLEKDNQKALDDFTAARESIIAATESIAQPVVDEVNPDADKAAVQPAKKPNTAKKST